MWSNTEWMIFPLILPTEQPEMYSIYLNSYKRAEMELPPLYSQLYWRSHRPTTEYTRHSILTTSSMNQYIDMLTTSRDESEEVGILASGSLALILLALARISAL